MSTETLSTASASCSAALEAIRACPFDLAARAELATEGCTGLTNPERGGQPFSYAEFHTDPPIALHAPWDYADSAGRLLDALTLARSMTGTKPDASDDAFAQLLRDCQQEDGLIALPPAPWTGAAPVQEIEWSPRGALMAWTTRYLALDDRDALHRAERLVHALNRHAVWQGDMCWYPGSTLPPDGWANRQPPTPRAMDILIGAQLVYPLCRFAGAAGNDEALTLAGGLIRYLREKSGAFQMSGRFGDHAASYLHSSTGFILGALKYGLLTGKDDLITWAKNAYDHSCEWGTDFGFFPWRTSGSDRWQGDACATTDMIEIALLLGLHRDPAYLAHAERYGRNHLLESQLLHFDWVQNRVDAAFCSELWCGSHPASGVSTDDICGRAVGAFASWSRVNDAIDPMNPRLMLRCTGAGTRALYDLWHSAVTHSEEAVKVNLHFSRDTRWCEVTSHVPQEGRLEILMKTRGVLAVRVPSDLTEDQIDVSINHARPRHEVLRNGYAWLECLQNGDLVTIQWPLQERAQLYEQDGTRYSGVWRGDTLLRLTPPGALSPLYTRPLETRPAPPRGASGPVREINSM